MQENVRSDEDNGNENVVKAFKTILNEILGGELKALQLAVSDLDTQLCRRMQAVEEKTVAISDHLRKELQSLVEERLHKIQQAEQDRKKAFFEHESRIDKTVAELKEQLQQSQQRQETRVDALKENLEHTLTSSETKLEERISTLSQSVASLQLDLQQQVETSQRMSALFDTMAAVFSAPTPQPGIDAQLAATVFVAPSANPSEGTEPPAAQTGQAEPAEMNGGDLEIVLEHVFPTK